ncbi:MAG: ribosome recycling factor [Patescibacteria group bacterium]|jgi:ribosome recycling factor
MTVETFTEKAEKTLVHLKESISSIRTGRANPSLVEGILVDYYGAPTPLLQMATITTPEPRMIVIQPWDKTQLKAVEAAVQQSDLQLPANNDGDVVRVNIPPLTEERRLEFVKVVHAKHEDAKIALKSLREDFLKELKVNESSEDVRERGEKSLQELVQKYQKAFTTVADDKEKEITSIT